MANPEVLEDTEEEESVILISDSQTESSQEDLEVLVDCLEEFPSSKRKSDRILDEDPELEVTFCKRAKLMPHARYDCMVNPFVRAEWETSSPLGDNAETCSECYCYLCNTPAVKCKDWVGPDICHCNAHNKSQYWKRQWIFLLSRSVAMFKLEFSEIDSDVRRGGDLLQKFIRDVTVEYHEYLMGDNVFSECHECLCHRNLGPGQCDFCGSLSPVTHRYTSVSDLVTTFLNQAANENPKTEAIALLGAAREILLHKDPSFYDQSMDDSASLSKAVTHLMERITRRLQKLLVVNSFSKHFSEKLTEFYHAIPFPSHCVKFAKSLDFFPWDHGLLTLVLKGQNPNGCWFQKGKKEVLLEIRPVIEARVERMETHQQYLELIRYLKVVKCDDFQWMQELRDKIPFYVCKTGDMERAVRSLFICYPGSCCTVCRLSPFQFEVYLKMFHTGQVPLGQDLEDWTQWSLAGGHLKLPLLIKWTVKLLYGSPTLYRNPKCWSLVIRTFGSSPSLDTGFCPILSHMKKPPLNFTQMVFNESCHILEDLANLHHKKVSFLDVFYEHKCLKAGLIFAVQAVRQMVLQEYYCLSSFLDIILAFGKNFWALKLLLDSLAEHKKALSAILVLTLNDLQGRHGEMLVLLKECNLRYVRKLLCLFLTSRNKNGPPVGLSIIRIIQANLQECWWAKEVGHFLGRRKDLAHLRSPEVLSFIEATRALP